MSRMLLSQSSIRQQIEKEIKENRVMMYSKTYCPYCDAAKELFEAMKVDIHVKELDTLGNQFNALIWTNVTCVSADGAKIQAELKNMTGLSTVPSIFVNQKHVGGASDAFAAYEDGSLEALINNTDS
jgi:glutaredoxin